MKIYTLYKEIRLLTLPPLSPQTIFKKTLRRFSRKCSQLQRHFKGNGNGNLDIYDTEFLARLQEVKHVFDLRNPAQFFMQARSMKRHVIFHAGPTNSGKTHNALKAFLQADNGIYCGPLRMLAGEVYRKSNAQDVPCDLLTGEERLWAVSRDEPAMHLACTVELCPTIDKYEVAVIDEIQMLRCLERGYAWTRALLGVVADEIHLCGEASAIHIVKTMLSKTDDTFEVRHYERRTPLTVLNYGIGDMHKLKEGDCVIAFRQNDIYNLRTRIERSTNLKCAVVYGNLPSNIRFEQAENFNNGSCDVLVASDAIGMGMNLNISRVIFNELQKFDGETVKSLTPHHIKQIAGRAGRYKSKYETGFVTSMKENALSKLRRLMKLPIKDIEQAGIMPTFPQLELLSLAASGKGLLELLELFEALIQLDKNYVICDRKNKEMKMVCWEIRDIPLTLSESFIFAIAPAAILKSTLVCRVMKQFAWHVYDKTCVTDAIVRNILRWPPNKTPRTISQLKHLEYTHEALDLYRWLSYRFEEIFIDTESIIVLQRQVERIISRAVDTNLKNYKRFHMRKIQPSLPND